MKRPRRADSSPRHAWRAANYVAPVVLVVNREPQLGERLRQALHGSRWNVEVINEGREALARFRVRAVSVCIVEDNLLDMSAIDLVRSLAIDHPESRFIVVGEPALTQRALHAVASSVEAHLESPVEDLDQALDIISHALRRRGEERPKLVKPAAAERPQPEARPPTPVHHPITPASAASAPKSTALVHLGDPSTNALAFGTKDPTIVSRTTALLATAAAMTNARHRDAIGDVLNQFLSAHFGCGLILICRKGLCLGWKGYAPGIDPDLIESVVVPLKADTMFRQAYKRRSIFVGPPPPDSTTLHARLWKLLGCEPPAEVIVAPVLLQQRVVALVYAHAKEGVFLPPTATVELASLAAVMEASFTRLIQMTKQPKGEPASS